MLGTYLHGLFANESVRAAFLEQVRETAGVDPPEKAADERTPYETAASLIGRLDLENAITSDGQQ